MAERRSVKGTVPAQAEDFASIIRLEQTGPGCFRNLYSDLDFQGGHMFGGQLLAQGWRRPWRRSKASARNRSTPITCGAATCARQ
jgi:hypothetical protein